MSASDPRTWGYRIIDFGTHLALHEVHFRGEAPVGYSAEPATFETDVDLGTADLVASLRRALSSITDEPVLPIAVFANSEEASNATHAGDDA